MFRFAENNIVGDVSRGGLRSLKVVERNKQVSEQTTDLLKTPEGSGRRPVHDRSRSYRNPA